MRPAFGIGIVLFVVAFAVAAVGMTSIPAPSFAVHVSEPSAFAPDGDGRWEVEVVPALDRGRPVARLDRSTDLTLVQQGDAGLVAELPGLSRGYHFIEAAVHRRGGREDQVVDVIAAGPFQAGRERPCDVALRLTPDAVRTLLLPAIEHKVVQGAREQEEFFGATSYIAESELVLVEGGLSFSVQLDTTQEDKGDLQIDGVVSVTSVGEAGLALALRELRRAAPGPKLAGLASKEGGRRGTTAGTGGGAVVGGLVGGPGGAVVGGVLGGLAGRAIGRRLGEREAGKRTQKQVYDALVDGLALATEELVLPAGVELLPTSPSLLGDVQWCGALELDARQGMRAALRLRLHEDERSARAAETATHRGAVLDTNIDGTDTHNASLRISEDLVNRLLAEWTALARAGLTDAIEAELGARTRWQVDGISAEFPPIVTLDEEAIGASLGGVALRLHDPQQEQTRDVVVGGVGRLDLEVRSGTRATMSGALSQAYFGCRLPADQGRILPACFSAAVDPDVIRRKINVAILVKSAQLPALDLSGLVRMRSVEATGSAVSLSDAALSLEAGALRLDATLVGG